MNQKQLTQFLLSWFLITVLFILSASVFRGNIVLGNDKVQAQVAAIVAAFIVTIVNYFVEPAIAKSGFKVKNQATKTTADFIANTVIIWFIKRLAVITGLGASSLLYVLILAVLITATQQVSPKILAYLPKTGKK